MIAKIRIKVYIVLACINFALRGYVMGSEIWSWLALLNMFFLFIILFQERDVFAHTGSKRVLFSADVFAYISIAIGLIGANLISLWYAIPHSLPQSTLLLFVGLLFYVLCVWIFRMHSKERVGHVTHIKGATRILTGLAVYLGSLFLPNISSVSNEITTWTSGFSESLTSLTDIPEDTDIADDTDRDSVATLLAQVRDQESERDNEDAQIIQAPDEENIDSQVQEVEQEGSVGLTFGSLLPLVVNRYSLGPARGNYSFTFVDQSSPLYESFAIARDYSMIGTATSPEQVVLCKHMMVLLGLAEGREVSGGDVFTIYWNEATRRGYTTSCSEQNAQATLQDFSSISYL